MGPRRPACRNAAMPELVARLLDPGRPFDLYFCVHERGLREWSIRHDSPTSYHLLYVPDSDPLIGTIDGRPVRVDPGTILWVQPGAVFRLAAHAPARQITLGVCRFELADDPVLRLPEPFRLGHRAEGEAVLDELLPGHEMDVAVDPLHRRAVLARIICRGFIEAEAPDGGSGLAAPLRHRLMAFMTGNITRRFGIHELADEAGMNADYLSRRFRRSFGAAPKTYIMRMRIRHAANYLLASGDDITAVAQRFGYDNAFLFSRQFRQVMGRSPSAWRARTGSSRR